MTNTQIDASLTIDELIRSYPRTVSVFNEFGIDACCGGAVSLEEAARRDGVARAQLLSALEAAIAELQVTR